MKIPKSIIRGIVLLMLVYTFHGFIFIGEFTTQKTYFSSQNFEKEIQHHLVSFKDTFDEVILLEEYTPAVSHTKYQRIQDNKGVHLKKNYPSVLVSAQENISHSILSHIQKRNILRIENVGVRIHMNTYGSQNTYLITSKSDIDSTFIPSEYIHKSYIISENERTKFCEYTYKNGYIPSICKEIKQHEKKEKTHGVTTKSMNSLSGKKENGKTCTDNNQCSSSYCNTNTQDSHMISFGGSTYSEYIHETNTSSTGTRGTQGKNERTGQGKGNNIGFFGFDTEHNKNNTDTGEKTLSANNPKEAALSFLESKTASYIQQTTNNANVESIQYTYTGEQPLGEKTFVYFTTSYKGIPREGKKHTVVVEGNNLVTQTITQQAPFTTLETSPSLTEDEIFTINSIEKENKTIELVLLETTNEDASESDILTYKVIDKDKDLITYYDAHTGELIHRYLTRFFEEATVKADVTTYGNQPVQGINYGGGQTDTTGKTRDTTTLSIELKSDTDLFPLQVKYDGSIPSKSYASQSSVDISNLQRQSVNMFRHMKRMQVDVLDKYFPNFTGRDRSRVTVNVHSRPYNGNGCNAYRNGTINMFGEASACNDGSFYEDILYHEFGHGINDKLYGGVGNGAIHEGFADVFAYAATEDLQLGEGRLKSGRIIRDYNNPLSYNQMSGEAHADGQPIAASFIRIAQKIGLVDMMKIFEELMFLRLDTSNCYPNCPISSTQSLFRKMFDATLNISKENQAHCNAVWESFSSMGIPSNSFSSNPCAGGGSNEGGSNEGGSNEGGSTDGTTNNGGSNEGETDSGSTTNGRSNEGNTTSGSATSGDNGSGQACSDDAECPSGEYCKKGSFTESSGANTGLGLQVQSETPLSTPYKKTIRKNTIQVKYKEDSFQYFEPFDSSSESKGTYIKNLGATNLGLQTLSSVTTLQEKAFEMSSSTLAEIIQGYSIQTLERPLENFEDTYNRATNIYKITTSSEQEAKKVIYELTSDPNVEYAEYTEAHIETTTNDPQLPSQRDKLGKSKNAGGMNTIEAVELSASRATGTIYVGINDSGVTASHKDLSPKMHGGGSDSHGHGTHVAGLAAAAGNNGIGVLGNAGAGSNIKIVECGTFGDIASCVNELKKLGKGVINMSWKYTRGGNTQGDKDAIAAANSAGIVMVAAAGNDYGNSDNIYPCAYDGVVCVASTTSSNRKSGFSNSGSKVDLSAPGSSVLSTCNNGGYCNKSGTSMASPNAAGAIAYLMALGASGGEAIRALQSTAINVGSGMGAGRIDVCNAVVKYLGSGTCTGSSEPNPGDGGGRSKDGVCTSRGRSTSSSSTAGSSTAGNSNNSTSTAGNSTAGNSNNSTSTAGNSTAGNSNNSTSTAGNSTAGNSNNSTTTAGNSTAGDDGGEQPPVCGNGTRETYEQCDDGNLENGDGCNEKCQRENCTPPDASSRYGGDSSPYRGYCAHKYCHPTLLTYQFGSTDEFDQCPEEIGEMLFCSDKVTGKLKCVDLRDGANGGETGSTTGQTTGDSGGNEPECTVENAKEKCPHRGCLNDGTYEGPACRQGVCGVYNNGFPSAQCRQHDSRDDGKVCGDSYYSQVKCTLGCTETCVETSSLYVCEACDDGNEGSNAGSDTGDNGNNSCEGADNCSIGDTRCYENKTGYFRCQKKNGCNSFIEEVLCPEQESCENRTTTPDRGACYPIESDEGKTCEEGGFIEQSSCDALCPTSCTESAGGKYFCTNCGDPDETGGESTSGNDSSSSDGDGPTTCLERTDTCDCRIVRVNGSCEANNKYTESELTTCRQDCEAENQPTYECPNLSKNKGDSCDDNNASTSDDIVQSNCTCSGTQSDNGTNNGSETGTPEETTCLERTDTCDCRVVTVQGSCEDNNTYTESELVTCRQECEAQNQPTYECPDLSKNKGDSCDDNDASTSDDIVQSNCTCSGTQSDNGTNNGSETGTPEETTCLERTDTCDCRVVTVQGSCEDNNKYTESELVTCRQDCENSSAGIVSFTTPTKTQSMIPQGVKQGICMDKPPSGSDTYTSEYGHLPAKYLHGAHNRTIEYVGDETSTVDHHDIRIVHTSNTKKVSSGSNIQHKIVVKYTSYAPHFPISNLEVDIKLSPGFSYTEDKSQLSFDGKIGAIATEAQRIRIPLEIKADSSPSSQDVFSKTYLGVLIFETTGNDTIQKEESFLSTVSCYNYTATHGTAISSSACSSSSQEGKKIIAQQYQSIFFGNEHGSADGDTTNGSTNTGTTTGSTSGGDDGGKIGLTTGSSTGAVGTTTGNTGTTTGTTGTTGSSNASSGANGGVTGSTTTSTNTNGSSTGSSTTGGGSGSTGTQLPAPKPVCGNGKIDAGESCDDKNTTNSDGCSKLCYEEINRSCSGSPSNCKQLPTVAREIESYVKKDLPRCSEQEVDYSKIDFKDINDSSWKSSILALQHYCVSKGTGGDLKSFDPNRRVSKAEFIKLLSKSMLLGSNHSFVPEGTEIQGLDVVDIDATHRAAQYVKIAQQAGLLDALTKKYFNGRTLTPNESITQDHLMNTFLTINEGTKLTKDDMKKVLGPVDYPTRGMVAELLVKKFIGSFEQYLIMQGKNKKYYGELVSDLQDKPLKEQVSLLQEKITTIKKATDKEFSDQGYVRYWILYLLEKVEKKF